jgi:hypothetical protein
VSHDRATVRRALRLARRDGGADQREIGPALGRELVEQGLLRQVTHRVALTGAILEYRWALTERGHYWLDEDSATPMLPPKLELEEEV